MSVSILILTLNEEVNLRDCVDSVKWSDDVVVLDSFSSDRTVEVARDLNVRVYQRKFDNYAAQRNFGLRDIPYRHSWVLMLDADERVPPDLQTEILCAVREAPAEVTMFLVRRRDHLWGRWIRRSSGYPTWFGRVVRVGQVEVTRAINEEYHTDGEVRHLQRHLDHFPFNKGFSEWIAKHDRYSTMEARLRVQAEQPRAAARELVSRDPRVRRRGLKAWLYGIPARPLVVFCGLYFWRGGVLEGRAGLTFSLLRAWYEFMIDCKSRELQEAMAGRRP